MRSIDLSARDSDAVTQAGLAALAARSRAGDACCSSTTSTIRVAPSPSSAPRLAAADGDAANVRFATLIDNSRSAERVELAARTIDRDVVKDWSVFPWGSRRVQRLDRRGCGGSAGPDRLIRPRNPQRPR